MAQRHIHYEAAFQDFLRSRGWPYLPIDETKKAIFSGARIKSFDFLVYPPTGPAWLVDVKGRKFPYELKRGRRYWENWVTRDDIEGLRQWEGVFGEGFSPVFVFVYWLVGAGARQPGGELHVFKNQCYAILCVDAAEYAARARPRSAKWDTVTVPTAAFRKMARPIQTDWTAHAKPSKTTRPPDLPGRILGL